MTFRNSRILAIEGLRMLFVNGRVKVFGLKKSSGTDIDRCKDIVEQCYDARKGYFRVTHLYGNYPVFYARDFGWCTPALINLGHKERVLSTLGYALKNYSHFGAMTVAINPWGKPFNFPDVFSPDSVAYFFRSLRIAGAKDLVMQYKDFLNSEIKRFENIAIGSRGVIQKKHFSGMRDYSVAKGSCYDMIMACMLSQEIGLINKMMKSEYKEGILINTLAKYDLKKNLIKYFWTGKYFRDSLEDDTLTGHVNVYPYYLGIISDKKMLKSSIAEIQARALDKPLPLKYEALGKSKSRFIWAQLFVKRSDGTNWEYGTVWTTLGMAYIDILSNIDKKKSLEHMEGYKLLIGRQGFTEVFGDDMKPYSSMFFTAENFILWASMYHDLKLRLNIKK